MESPGLKVLVAYAAFGASVLFLSLATGARSLGLIVIGALALLASSLFLRDAIRRPGAGQPGGLGLRLGVALFLLAASAVALLVWSRQGDGEGWGVLAVLTVVFTLGAIISGWRRSRWGEHVRGPLLLAVAAGLLIGGIWGGVDRRPGWSLTLVLVGLALAYLGTVAYSEDWTRRAAVPTDAVMVIVGGLVLVAGIALLWGMGAHPLFVALAVVVICVMVMLTASDTDGDLLVIALVFVLVSAAVPQPGGPEAPTVDPERPVFASFGDSYNSGEGADEFYTGTNEPDHNECRRAPTAYPVRLAETSEVLSDQVLFLACSGARGLNLWPTGFAPDVGVGLLDDRGRPDVGRPQYDGEPLGGSTGLTQADQYAGWGGAEVTAAIVSIGGNDAGFGEIGKTCVGPGDCSEIGQIWLDRLDRVERVLDVTYAQLAEAVGDLPVLVVPYPVPISGTPCRLSVLSGDEHRFLQGFVHQLNDVVERAAGRAGFHYVDTAESALTEEGLRLCDGPWDEWGVNYLGIHPPSGSLQDRVTIGNWIHNSLHPNARGHEAMAASVEDWLRREAAPSGRGGLPAPPDPVESDRYVPVSVPEAVDLADVEHCEEDDGGPDLCTLAEEPARWQQAQTIALLRRVALPVVMVAVGAWLLAMVVIARSVRAGITVRDLVRSWWRRRRGGRATGTA